jgi:hypothetical protein
MSACPGNLSNSYLTTSGQEETVADDASVSCSSAAAVIGVLSHQRPQWAGQQSKSGKKIHVQQLGIKLSALPVVAHRFRV